jgi:hypothetical protein
MLHWYIPFSCKRVRVPDQEATTLRNSIADSYGGSTDAFYDLIEPFLNTEFTSVSTVYHRLPLWLIALPQRDRLLPCLYISAQRLGGFYPNQTFPLDGDPVLPCFASFEIPEVVKVSVREYDEATILRFRIFSCLLLADERILVFRLRFEDDERKGPFVEQQEIDEASGGFLEVLAEVVERIFCECNTGFELDVRRPLRIREEAPARCFEQLVYLNPSSGFLHLRSVFSVVCGRKEDNSRTSRGRIDRIDFGAVTQTAIKLARTAKPCEFLSAICERRRR